MPTLGQQNVLWEYDEDEAWNLTFIKRVGMPSGGEWGPTALYRQTPPECHPVNLKVEGMNYTDALTLRNYMWFIGSGIQTFQLTAMLADNATPRTIQGFVVAFRQGREKGTNEYTTQIAVYRTDLIGTTQAGISSILL